MKPNEAPEKIYLIREEDDVMLSHEPQTQIRNGGRYDYVDKEVFPIKDGVNIEYIRIDVIRRKVKEAFCKAVCNGKPPRSTCTSLGTCKQYDEFIKETKRLKL